MPIKTLATICTALFVGMLQLLAQQNVGIGTADPSARLDIVSNYGAKIAIEEDFEEGEISELGTTGDAIWTAQQSPIYEGNYSGRSGVINATQSSVLTIIGTIPDYKQGTLSFYITWDLGNHGFVNFGDQEFSGSKSWVNFSASLGPGPFEFTIKVYGDGTTNDAGYVAVDNVVVTYDSGHPLRIADGREGDGKILISDAYGNANWSNPELPNRIEDADGDTYVRANDVNSVDIYASGQKVLDLRENSITSFGIDFIQIGRIKDSLGSIEIGDNSAIGQGAMAWGESNIARGKDATAFGWQTKADSLADVAWGWGAKANGVSATAFGYYTRAQGYSSTAWGWQSRASEAHSTAFGGTTDATGPFSTAWGYAAEASGYGATAFGNNSTASGKFSTALGVGTIAKSYASIVMGSYNEVFGGESSTEWIGTDPLLVVGNGPQWGLFSNALVLLKNGKLGIGTYPASTFHVFKEGSSDARFESETGDVDVILDGATGNNAIEFHENNTFQASLGWSTANDRIFFYQDGTNAMYISGGNVGIKNPTPTYDLDLPNSAANGTARAFQWLTYSDARIKDNIRSIDHGLEEVLALNPVRYDQHRAEQQNGNLVLSSDAMETIGLLAQEVYGVIPEAVNTPKDETSDLWSMDYEKLVPVLIKAIQDQQNLIESQGKRLEQIEALLKSAGHTD